MTDQENPFNKDDEIITVRLPARDYKVLREILEREKTWNWISKWTKSGFVWIVIGAVMTLITFWDQIKRIFS